ncbi:Sec39 domain-containing protein [Phaeosphaeriaceae sp. PMI808]|nr:Sec39 domain-containing protein [Phaeosphaeriaceae sp. PMI808]
MATLNKLQQLSSPHCVLLAVQYATESNIKALRVLTALRDTDLPLDLILSILLTYLPEELEPSSYVEFLHGLTIEPRDPGDDPAATLNVASIDGLSISRAKKRRKALALLPIVHPLYVEEDQLDPFSHFLVHRAHRIDAQTGLLDQVPGLIVPFLDHSEYLRTWFISTILPLLRLSYEYYPQAVTGSLDDFAQLQGKHAIEFQLSNTQHTREASIDHVARDLKGVVAPWMCGANDRKRRKLSGPSQDPDDWNCLFRWIVQASKDDLQLAFVAINGWDGPEDMDLGGFEEGRDYIDDEQQRQLEMQYAQTALACLYLLLPSYKLQKPLLQESSSSLIQEHRLLDPDNELTKPSGDSIQILKLIIFSACTLSRLQNPVSCRELVKISLRHDRSEQLSLLHKILHKLNSSKKDSEQLMNARLQLLWLWDWGTHEKGIDCNTPGIFGMLERIALEVEILEALIEGSHYSLVVQTYIRPSTNQKPLSLNEVEMVVLKSAMHHYDNASNGNRTRGGMKRAAEIIAAFTSHFSQSSRFQRAQALFTATHALSFYSLILQHGVPFQPVNIRVSSNPLSLIQKLLSQNNGSYTKLDDLVSIGQNLIVSMPSAIMDSEESPPLDPSTMEQKKAATERRVIGMAIDAALEEDDFETAYSYVVNRLTPLTPSPTPSIPPQRFSFGSVDTNAHEDEAEDVAWRAALRAGRYNSSHPLSSSWSQTAARPDLRRLEQRMELLSQALLLAPPAHLEEVLSVWRECETDYTALLAEEIEAEVRFNDAADRRLPGTFVNDTITVQPRREVGRGAVEEAPMGLFDVARGAAAAFSKSAFPLRGGAQAVSDDAARDDTQQGRASMDLSDSGSMDDRVRKRDMVANAATGALASGTGALASGLGWMLGAKPVHEQDRE